MTHDPHEDVSRTQTAVDRTSLPRRPSLGPDGEPVSGTRIGPYLVLDQRAAGGMGVVVTAYDEELKRVVALKFHKRGGQAAQLLREAELAASVVHPNVIPIFHADEYEDGVFVAMEFVDGQTLSDWVKSKPSTADIVAAYFQAGRGLAAAHAQGVVHRDFKPTNAVVGSDGRVRVLDFGIAIAPSSSPADPSIAAGTPAYMAPEQLTGPGADHRSDQFAYCASFYEALTGTRPPREADIPRSSLPKWLHRLLARGLSPDPANRYPSMGELLSELERGAVAPFRSLPALVAAAAIVVALFGQYAMAASWWTGSFLADLELRSVDLRFRWRGTRSQADDRIVIVGIDDQSRAANPRIIASRHEHARLVEALARYEPRAIGLDILYANPEAPLPTAVTSAVHEANRALESSDLPARPTDETIAAALAKVLAATSGDEVLAHSIERAGNVYLGALLYLEGGPLESKSMPEPAGLAGARYPGQDHMRGPLSERPPIAEERPLAPLDSLARVAKGAGTLNLTVDSDGAIRRVYTSIEHGGRLYMPLSMSVARTMLDDDDVSYSAGREYVTWGKDALIVDRRGIARLNFLGPAGTIRTISANEVLRGKALDDALRDKLVFLGRTDRAQDTYPTPFDPLMPGVEIQATLAHNVLHAEFLRTPSPGAATALLALLLSPLLIAAARVRAHRNPGKFLGATLVAAPMLFLAYAQYAFAKADTVTPVAYPLFAYLLAAGLTVAAYIIVVSGERERARLLERVQRTPPVPTK